MTAAKHIRQLARGPWGPWERRVVPVEERERRGSTDAARFREDNFLNAHFSVQISDEPTAWGPVIHLWIRRHDAEPIRSWAALQRIKNELVGADRTAIEVFPRVAALVDTADMYHLWVLPADMRLPFSLGPVAP